MRSTRRSLLALMVTLVIAACSGGGGDSSRQVGLHFEKLAAPPRAIGPTASLVENADAVLALIDSRLFRYDPWTENAIWLELGRNLPSAKSRLVSWNDRVWYLTTDRGQLELASVALSGEQRSDTRVVTGATDAKYAIVAGRTSVYVFGDDGGFRIDREGVYAEFPGPPGEHRVADWSTAHVAELDDGSIAVASDQRVRWIFEADVAQWREPPNEVAQLDIRSIAVTSDGLYVVTSAPLEAFRLAAANRIDTVAAPFGRDCASPTVYATDLGPVSLGCGKAWVREGEQTRTIDIPAGTSVVPGPRGRPMAIASTTGDLLLLQ